jgi:hypothetical protein
MPLDELLQEEVAARQDEKRKRRRVKDKLYAHRKRELWKIEVEMTEDQVKRLMEQHGDLRRKNGIMQDLMCQAHQVVAQHTMVYDPQNTTKPPAQTPSILFPRRLEWNMLIQWQPTVVWLKEQDDQSKMLRPRIMRRLTPRTTPSPHSKFLGESARLFILCLQAMRLLRCPGRFLYLKAQDSSNKNNISKLLRRRMMRRLRPPTTSCPYPKVLVGVLALLFRQSPGRPQVHVHLRVRRRCRNLNRVWANKHF